MKPLFALVLVVAAVGLGRAVVAGDKPEERGTLITRLAHRDFLIDVYTGKAGARYDVSRQDGTLVAENASLDQLRAKAPEAYDFVKHAVALDASNEKSATKFRPILDAGE